MANKTSLCNFELVAYVWITQSDRAPRELLVFGVAAEDLYVVLCFCEGVPFPSEVLLIAC